MTDWPDEQLLGAPGWPGRREVIVLKGSNFGTAQYHIENVNDPWQSFLMPKMPPYPTWDLESSAQWKRLENLKQYFDDLEYGMRYKVLAPTYKVMVGEWKDNIAYEAGLGAFNKTSLDDAFSIEQWEKNKDCAGVDPASRCIRRSMRRLTETPNTPKSRIAQMPCNNLPLLFLSSNDIGSPRERKRVEPFILRPSTISCPAP